VEAAMNREAENLINIDDQFDFSELTKKVFDHFRNYMICASLFYVGFAALKHPEWHYIGEFGSRIAMLVIFLTIILTLLNTVQVASFIMKNFKPLKVPGKNRKRGFLAGPFLLLTYLSVAYVIVVVALNIKLSGH
jgi:hypothetical protein